MQGGDLLLDLSFFDGRSIALAQEIEPGRADVAFAPDPGIANIACHRTGAGAVALAATLQLLDQDVKATRLFGGDAIVDLDRRSEEHTSELQSLMRTSYAVFCLKKKNPATQ